MLVVQVACKNEEEARSIAAAVIREKLAACANYWKCESVFGWKGRLVEESEVLLELKTTENNYKRLEKKVMELHSYDLPGIIAFKAGKSNREYGKWVEKNSGKKK